MRPGNDQDTPPPIQWHGPPITDTAGPPGGQQFDWHAYLQDWGFPPDVIQKLDQIFRNYTNPQDAAAAALAYIRGTDWYRITFPGIQEGERLGIISDERDYRAYVNQLNQQYRNFYSRDVSSAEVAGYLQRGWGVTQVGQHLYGQAVVGTQTPQLQYVSGAFGDTGQLSKEELAAYGDEVGGMDNTTGLQVQKRIALAQQRLQRIMEGSLATPALSLLGGQRLGTSGGGASNTTDVSS